MISLLSSENDAFSLGCCLRASATALVMNGRYVRFTPACCWKEALAFLRSCTMRVTSTSCTWVSWVDRSRDSRMRWAMTWRMRGAFSTSPRTEGSTEELAAGADAAAGADDGAAASEACSAGASDPPAAACEASAAASTSCLRMRPPTPVPRTVDRSTLSWWARRRTSGVT